MDFLLAVTSFGEKMSTGFMTFFVGIMIVFIVLFTLIGAIKLLERLMLKAKFGKKSEPKSEIAEELPEAVAFDNGEIIAAITVAIAVIMEAESAATGAPRAKFVVKSIKQLL